MTEGCHSTTQHNEVYMRFNKIKSSNYYVFGAFSDLKFILLVELLYATAGVYQLLLTREKGVTLIANINL